MTETIDTQALLELATEVARRAGRMLRDERPRDLGVTYTKSSPTDVVTEMDTASEKLIVEALRAARPEDGFLGEEGASDTSASGVRWIIDPIDGTVNYLYDLPGWAVSIAAEVRGEVAAGVVYVPGQDETFTAVRGGGAFRNGEPIRCTRGVPLERALVATGFAYAAARRAAQAEVLRGLLPRVRDIRRFGSAAVDLCMVACGRVDAYYERGVNLWDYAAGKLIAEEAGARVGGLRGEPASPELILAAAPDLYEQLHDLLTELGADRDS